MRANTPVPVFWPTETMPRRWGWWKVLEKGKLDRGDEYKIKMLRIDPGKSISLQYHDNRDEYWIIMQGVADTRVGDHPVSMPLVPGDIMRVPRGELHKITNTGKIDLIILELQMGPECDEEDITRLEKIDGEG